MKYVFSPAGRRTLARVCEGNVLLAFDYDGTLSPIVEDPQDAAMRERTRSLLAELARSYPCAVISGRARADVVSRLDGIRLAAVIGNHGAEPLPGARLSVQVRRWRSSLEPSLATLKGVEIEDKHLSLSVHYRHSADKDSARGAILHATRLLEGARIIGGKQVVNVLPFGARHKGSALDVIRRKQGCDSAIYVGDDDTDEDVFALAKAHHVVGIRVGARRATHAEYYVRSQAEMDRLLEELLRHRRAPVRRPEHGLS
jgi:trehalose 6-phosphate phosphatase